MNSRPKYSICFNMLVWGEAYANLLLDVALKSLLDETNLPAIRDRADFLVVTDKETEQIILAHDNYHCLRATLPVRIANFTAEGNKYNARYEIQAHLHRECIADALKNDTAMSFLAPDATYGKGFCQGLLAKLDEGYSAVLGLPMRSAAEPMIPILLGLEGAPTAEQLFQLAYANLHPHWVASNWDAPMFTRLPYTMLWTNSTQIVARSFSISPHVVVPTEEMLAAGGVVDCGLPSMCKNAYVALNWAEFPMAAVEFLACWYPPFSSSRSSTQRVAEWSRRATVEGQERNLAYVLQYRMGEEMSDLLLEESNVVIRQIMQYRSAV